MFLVLELFKKKKKSLFAKYHKREIQLLWGAFVIVETMLAVLHTMLLWTLHLISYWCYCAGCKYSRYPVRLDNLLKSAFLHLFLQPNFCPFFNCFVSVTCRNWRGWAPGRSRRSACLSLRRGFWMLWPCGSSSTWTRRAVCLLDPRRTPAGNKPSTQSTAPRVRFSRLTRRNSISHWFLLSV